VANKLYATAEAWIDRRLTSTDARRGRRRSKWLPPPPVSPLVVEADTLCLRDSFACAPHVFDSMPRDTQNVFIGMTKLMLFCEPCESTTGDVVRRGRYTPYGDSDSAACFLGPLLSVSYVLSSPASALQIFVRHMC
jgi:hypothetical protein